MRTRTGTGGGRGRPRRAGSNVWLCHRLDAECVGAQRCAAAASKNPRVQEIMIYHDQSILCCMLRCPGLPG